MAVQEGKQELWGAETTKAVENFQVSGDPVHNEVVHWLGRIKAAAARVNAELGLLDPDWPGAGEHNAGEHERRPDHSNRRQGFAQNDDREQCRRNGAQDSDRGVRLRRDAMKRCIHEK